MFIQYKNKKSEEEILNGTSIVELEHIFGDINNKNKLILGENLSVLKTLCFEHNLKGKVDLIYIDPPFATNNHFTIGEGRVSTISNCKSDKTAYKDELLGADFLEFLRERLIFLRELLSEKGSIYLHIDYKIGHYVKIIMDEVFGINNFRNDITRIKCNPKNFKRKAYGNIKDLILFYSKSDDLIWNDPTQDFEEVDINKLFKKTDQNGRKYTTIPLHAPGETTNGATGKEWNGIMPPKGRHRRTDPKILEEWNQQGLIEWSSNGVPRKKIFADERNGKKMQDIWNFKDNQYPIYPTEKNIDLLETIIKASSNEGDLILDCFCGSGTTLQAAHNLKRKWIGIDQSKEAIKIIQKRLEKIPTDLFTQEKNYEFLKQEKKYNIEKSIKSDILHEDKKHIFYSLPKIKETYFENTYTK